MFVDMFMFCFVVYCNSCVCGRYLCHCGAITTVIVIVVVIVVTIFVSVLVIRVVICCWRCFCRRLFVRRNKGWGARMLLCFQVGVHCVSVFCSLLFPRFVGRLSALICRTGRLSAGSVMLVGCVILAL